MFNRSPLAQSSRNGRMTSRSDTLTAFLSATTLALLLSGCGEEAFVDSVFTECRGATGSAVLAGPIAADTSLCAGITYTLRGIVYVGGGATLRVEPGTLVEGERGSAIVVTPAGRIEARGTADAPIVFTSEHHRTAPRSGDWGGLVLLGRAPIATASGVNQIEGIEPTDGRAQYGGDDHAFDCGSLRYVRIEYAGAILGDNNELNGLTLGGCGTNTEVEFVQVAHALDDGIELFGGTTNLRHIVITDPGDDGIDLDEGYLGDIQFAYVRTHTATTSDPRGIEIDGDTTLPRLANVTVVGASYTEHESAAAIVVRTGAALEVRDSILSGFNERALAIYGASSTGSFAPGSGGPGADATSRISATLFVGSVSEPNAYVRAFDVSGEDAGIEQPSAHELVDTSQNSFGIDPELDGQGVPTDVALATTYASSPPVEFGDFFVDTSYAGAFDPSAPSLWISGWTRE